MSGTSSADTLVIGDLATDKHIGQEGFPGVAAQIK